MGQTDKRYDGQLIDEYMMLKDIKKLPKRRMRLRR